MKYISIILIAVMFYGCMEQNDNAVYGRITASEIYLSAEVSGRITEFSKSEGEEIKAGEIIAVIDTSDIQLQIDELNAMIDLKQLAIDAKETELAMFQQEKANLEIDLNRYTKLSLAEATAEKNLDDIEAKLRLLDIKLKLAAKSIEISQQELKLAKVKKSQTESRKKDYFIVSVQDAAVLEKYLKKGELVTAGKPICKIADLSFMTAKLYVSATELPYLRIGEEVTLKIDGRDGILMSFPGKISRISSEAEFTPKVIQTREERVNLVYEIEVECSNDGSLKIGMPVEMVSGL